MPQVEGTACVRLEWRGQGLLEERPCSLTARWGGKGTREVRRGAGARFPRAYRGQGVWVLPSPAVAFDLQVVFLQILPFLFQPRELRNLARYHQPGEGPWDH